MQVPSGLSAFTNSVNIISSDVPFKTANKWRMLLRNFLKQILGRFIHFDLLLSL